MRLAKLLATDRPDCLQGTLSILISQLFWLKEMFNKLSIPSESQHEKPFRATINQKAAK